MKAAKAFRLSPRQTQVALLLISGLARKEIAGALSVSIKTVDYHIEIVRLKTNTRTDCHTVCRLVCSGELPSYAPKRIVLKCPV